MAIINDKNLARVRIVQEIAEQAKAAYEDAESPVITWSQGRTLKFEDS